MKPHALHLNIALLIASRPGLACDLCNGPPPTDDSDVLELSPDLLEAAVESHPLLVLMMYDSWDGSKPADTRLRNYANAATTLISMDSQALRLCKVDISAYPEVAQRLEVPTSTLPTMRLLRGDAGFGAEYRGGMTTAEMVSALWEEHERGGLDRVVEALNRSQEEEWRAAAGTRVVARLRRPESRTAFGQVAATFRNAIRFGLVSPPPTQPPAPPTTLEPPSLPPPPQAVAPPRSPPPLAPPSPPPLPGESEAEAEEEEEVLLFRERSGIMAGEAVDELRMPLARGGGNGGNGGRALTERTLQHWVRWAALPTVFQLTRATAGAYLHSGNVGIVFVATGGAEKQVEYVTRRLRRIADGMLGAGQHGLWLLWAERGDAEHARLREMLGLPPVTAGAGAAGESEFVIARMRSSRVTARYVMEASPFSYAAVADFAGAFARNELRPDGWQKELVRWAPLWLPAALLVIVLMSWRANKQAPPPAAAAPSGAEAGAEGEPPPPTKPGQDEAHAKTD